MEWIGEIWRRLRALVRSRQNDRELEEEMRLHVELRAEEQMKTGVAPDDARSTAQQRFGNALLMKERSCDVWGWRWLETFLQDLRYGARMLRKSPAFTAVAILSLAIGIGANTAIFSVVNAILLKSMPVRDPEQLRLVLWTGEPRIPMSTGSGYSTTLHNIEVHSSFSYPMYQLLATSVPQFSDVMGFAHADLTVLAAGESHYAGALFVTGNFFRGAGAGLTFASPLSKLVLALAGGKNPLTLDVQVDARTLLFTVATALLTALIFGLAPAFRATRINLTPSLKDGATGGFGATPHSRLSRSLIVGQVALSTLLLAGAGLFIRTLVNLAKVDPGFQSQQLLIFTVDGSHSGYEAGKLLAVYERIREKVSAIPGVRAATFSMFPLIAGSMSNSDISVPGYSPKGKESARTYEMVADSGFLAAMGIPILLGRDLNDGDTPNAPMVAVVNETFVRDYFAGNNPLGKIFYFGQLTGQPKVAKDTVQIIGVCRDAKYTDLRSAIPPTAYLSYLQNADWVGQATFEVRTAVPPLSIAHAVRRAVAETDRDVPVADLLTQEQQIRMSLSPERLAAGLIGSFGLIAALLAAIGLYGVMAYTVTRRTSEIGIRMALGAGCNAVLWRVLRGSLFMVAIGIGIGVPTALALTQVVREALYGIEPNDPVSFIAASVLMLAVATVAAWIPAQRAGRVDPMQALRHE